MGPFASAGKVPHSECERKSGETIQGQEIHPPGGIVQVHDPKVRAINRERKQCLDEDDVL